MNQLARERIRAALHYAGATHTPEDVAAMVEEGKAQLWHTPDATIVTEIHVYPQQRVLHFWLAGGAMSEVVELSHSIEEWARTHYGIRRATLAGRRGWERALRDDGWAPDLVLLSKEI